MTAITSQEPTRRDMLYLATGALAAVGTAVVYYVVLILVLSRALAWAERRLLARA
mgnify:CR=1 FL=1